MLRYLGVSLFFSLNDSIYMSSDKWFMRLVISLFMRICPEFL